MRPLFSYYGGKQKMASKITKLLPRHTVYVEPFCGGASVFFAKPWPPVTNNDHYREILNDLDDRIINLFRVVQDQDAFQEFQKIVSVPYSRSVYNQTAAKLRADEPLVLPDVEAAATYYTNVQQGFANKLLGGWGTGVYGRNLAITWAKQIARLPQYLDRLMYVHLESLDALAVIKKWDSPQTLFYCDPPYSGAAQRGYKHQYTQEQFEALCQMLNSCKGSFVLSTYKNDAIPGQWTEHLFAAHCTASGKGKTQSARDTTRAAPAETLGDRKRTEHVYVVDRSDTARPELQKVWATWATKGFQWGGDSRNYSLAPNAK